MLLSEWKPFSTDMKLYTQEVFEELVDDGFEAMLLEEGNALPSIIWTTNFVCLIKPNTRMVNDISITKIQRNPVCE